MSRRKRNLEPPKRRQGDQVEQFLWNTRSKNNEILSVESDPTDNVNMRIVDNDCHLGVTEYMFVLSHEVCLRDAVGIIGSFSGQLLICSSEERSNLSDTNVVVGLVKHDSIKKSSLSSNGVNAFIKVSANFNQIDSLSYLYKRNVIIIVSDVDISTEANTECKLMVYLNKSGFTAVDDPNEHPCMKKIHTSLKIVMEWLNGPYFTENEHDTSSTENGQNFDHLIQSVFDSLKSKQLKDKRFNDQKVYRYLQHPFLVPSLRDYQKQAIQWMIDQENAKDKIPEKCHPLWQTINIGKIKAWYNPYTGRISENEISPFVLPTGGILADEMGLGKTVEVLGCILNNPRKFKTDSGLLQKIIPCDFSDKEENSMINEKDQLKSLIDLNVSMSNITESMQVDSPPNDNLEYFPCHGKHQLVCDYDLMPRPEKKIKLEECSLSEDNNSPFTLNNISENDCFQKKPSADVSEITNQFKDIKMRCICGATDFGPNETILVCQSCQHSQHPSCVGWKSKSQKQYVCPDCCSKMPLLQSNTTLIISPVPIAYQWLDEIHRHIKCESLNVMVYKGVAKHGYIYPSMLARNDIILTTYDVLKRDFHHLASKKNHYSHRQPKRYVAWPCPLTCIQFWRICLDEAQMVENTTAKTTETALHLTAVHRWCVTGTPIQKSVDDLYGLFLFLGVAPYYKKHWWKKLLHEPFMRGDIKPLRKILYQIMWRTAKIDVIDQVKLPHQDELMNWLNFSPVEYHFYRRQYEDCSKSALSELRKFQESEMELSNLGRNSFHKVMWPLLKLRQACCHPQAVRGGYLAIKKNVITMDQLLNSLTNKAKIECQEAHRQLLCAINGLAGIFILQQKYQEAVDMYREAMDSWKEHEERFKTDSLQKLHTLYNLDDILTKNEKCSRTLSDDDLRQKALEIKEKYLMKRSYQVENAENDARNAWKAHDELKLKIDFKCPWWMSYIQTMLDERFPAHNIRAQRLLEKIKFDLAAVRNAQEFDSINLADRFSDLHGLQLVLFQKLDAIEDSQINLFTELKKIMKEPTNDIVQSAAECCLRPVANSSAPTCCFCKVNNLLSVYESSIFAHQGYKDADGESITGLRAETEEFRALKSIYAFFKSENKRNFEDYFELQQQAQLHMEYLESIRKNFKVYRQLWNSLRQRVSALDELSMCTMRLRLRFPGENIPENQFYIVDPTEIERTKLGFCSDKTLAHSSLRKSLGQLLYLKNLAKTQSTEGGENTDNCPVCTKVLGYQWSVFSCGHCLCCECMWVLLEQPRVIFQNRSNVRCPLCRHVTMVEDISYVSTVRQLTDEDKDINVKGSHSTKIEAVLRTLIKIQRTDIGAKTLVFSTWQDVLDVIAHALDENNMKYRAIKKSKDFESNLEEFKRSQEIHTLLIPLHSGSNGLNIIEATHMILVEPSLNPSLERQAVSRIHRIGQTKATFVHRLLIKSSVEEKIVKFLQNKEESGKSCCMQGKDGENVPLTVGELASFFEQT